MSSHVATMREYLASFRRDRRGFVAVTFGICLGVFLLVIGAGIMFTQLLQAEAAMQNAADAQAIAAAVEYASFTDQNGGTLTASDAQTAIYGTCSSGTPTAGCGYEGMYGNAGTSVMPATLTSVTWSTPQFSTGTPYTATITGQATYTSPPLAAFGGVLNTIGLGATHKFTVTATATVPSTNQTSSGNCQTSAGDSDTMSVYTVPRGLVGNYAPDTSTVTKVMYANKTYSSCSNPSYTPPAGTDYVGFALEDITGNVALGSAACDYNYTNNNAYLTGNNGSYGYGNNLNNSQYGAECGSQNWSFSTTYPPTLDTTANPNYTSCGGAHTLACDGGGPIAGTSSTSHGVTTVTYTAYLGAGTNTGTSQLGYYNQVASSAVPGQTWIPSLGYPTSTDNALEILQYPTSSTQSDWTSTSSGGTNAPYMIDPANTATHMSYNYTSPGTDNSTASLACTLSYMSGSSGSELCGVQSSTSDAYKTLAPTSMGGKGLGIMDCSQHPATTYMYFWNDMGGYAEDLDYNDMNFYWACQNPNPASNESSAVGLYAFISQ